MASSRQSDETHAADGTDGEALKRSRSLRPLAGFRHHLLRHRAVLALAAVALVVSAVVMLVVPLAVRRMIDSGFSGQDNVALDQSFLFLIGIGAALAIASSARF